MKKYKKFTLFVALSLSCFSLSLFTLTSCSSISKDIVNNMVDPKSADKFSENVSLTDEIKAALTDKTATDAFKGKVVDKILTHWWDSIKTDNVSVKDQDKTFNNDIDKDWDDKVSSAKSSHKHDWQYFIQNQDLNPVGGTIAKWKESQREQKIRSYFIDKVFSQSYLALADKDSSNTNEDDDLTQPICTLSGNVDQIITTDPGKMNFKNWHNINFWPTMGNPSYSANTNNNLFLDGSYAAIQRSAFELYTNRRRPISTAMCLWKYSDVKEDTLKEWYREDSTHVTADSLSKPSFSYPFFSDSTASATKSVNDRFYDFMKDLTGTSTSFIEPGTGLNRIPYNITNSKYTDDSSDVFLINTDTGITDSFETYGAPMIQVYSNSCTQITNMPVYTLPDPTDGLNIMDAFLLTASPGSYGSNVIDLFNVYPKSSDATDHSDLFNKDSTWYTSGKRYLVNAYALTSNSVAIPYILIRNDSGVHVEGIDGYTYLSLAANPTNLPGAGAAYSQTRENQILKYRTLCENIMKDQSYSGEGIAFLKTDGTGPLKDFFSSNTNDIILNTAQKVLNTSGNTYDWKAKNILGLKDIATDSDISIITNNSFTNFINAIAQYNLFNSNLTNYDASNKKLLAFGNTYRQNYFCSHIKAGVYDQKIYKNGLAIALPITFDATTASPGNPFLTNTSYAACVAAEKMIWNDAGTDPINGSPTKATRESLETQLATTYSALFTTSIHGDTSRHEYNYSGKKNGLSENILTNNDFINSLLWSFGSGNNFSNIEKVKALNTYLGSGSTILTTYQEQITSIYYSSKLFSDSAELSTYYNHVITGANADAIFSNYKNQLNESFKKYLNVAGSTDSSTSSSCPAYAQSYIDYLTLQASIKYLTNDNNKNFITWLGNKIPKPYISTNSIQPMYIAWCAKDDQRFNVNFGKTQTTDFDFKNNYNGILAGTSADDPNYQNTNISTPPTTGSTTYTSNTNYYQFARYNNNDMFNFYGIQTADSSTLPDIVKQQLFTHYVMANKDSIDPNYGSLYGLGSLDNTKDMIDSLSTTNDILTFIETLNKQTQGDYFTSIYNDIKNNNRTVAQAQSSLKTLLDTLCDQTHTDPLQLKNAFLPYNQSAASSYKILNITNNKKDNHFFPDSTNSTIGSHAEAVSLNYYDLHGNSATPDYSAITSTLTTALGDSLFKTLIVQAAMDTNIQSKVINDVVKVVYHGSKEIVYDRRYNDQLGSDWVKDFKTANS